MNQSTPAVSIIIPIYNVEKYLEQCLESIRVQTLRNIEIICVDDGATDNSPAIIDAFAANDNRFKPIHKANGGYGAGVNAGLSVATGTYIGIVEPDDYIEKNMYELLYKAADDNNDPDIVKAAYWRVINADAPDQEILPANYYHCVQPVNKPFLLKDNAEFLYHHPSIWTAIYKRDFLEKHEIKMHEIPGAGWADNPWLIETLAQAQSIVYVDECVYFYRESIPGSSSLVKDPSIIYDRWLDMDAFIKKQNISDPLILEGHYNRGCAYLEMILHNFDVTDPATKQGIDAIVANIDGAVVSASFRTPPEYKEAYFEAQGGAAWFTYRVKRKLRLA